jgi:hypothetical protein
VLDQRFLADLVAENEQLRRALAGRAHIEQAKGIIMGLRRCSADDAFGELVVVSNRNNVNVAALASALACCVDPSAQTAAMGPQLGRIVISNWLSDFGPITSGSGGDAANAWGA